MNGSENTPEIIAKRAQEYLLDDIIRYTAIASALRYVLTGSTTR